tara:strand:- start:2078 stop:2479 length:402 start_codon:yes stop_codon:yes gene_type:complete
MNLVIISGNLGANPEVRQTASGLAVVNLRIATNERVKVDGEWADHTEWHAVTVFGKQAEVCGKYLSKGSKATVQGKLRTRKFTDKNGQDKWTTEILADSVEFMSPAQTSGPPAPMQSSTTQNPPPFTDEEIPF